MKPVVQNAVTFGKKEICDGFCPNKCAVNPVHVPHYLCLWCDAVERRHIAFRERDFAQRELGAYKKVYKDSYNHIPARVDKKRNNCMQPLKRKGYKAQPKSWHNQKMDEMHYEDYIYSFHN